MSHLNQFSTVVSREVLIASNYDEERTGETVADHQNYDESSAHLISMFPTGGYCTMFLLRQFVAKA